MTPRDHAMAVESSKLLLHASRVRFTYFLVLFFFLRWASGRLANLVTVGADRTALMEAIECSYKFPPGPARARVHQRIDRERRWIQRYLRPWRHTYF